MDTDDLIRSATKSAKSADDALRALSHRSNEDLYAALAMRVGNTVDDQYRGATGFNVPFDADELRRDSESVNIGWRVFARWNRALHQFVCQPEGEDAKIRDQLLRALTGKEGGIAVIAGILVATFGASPAVAALVAALLVRILVVPAADEVCRSWASSIRDNAGAPR